MPIRTSEAEWQGNLKEGRGHMRLGGGAYDGAYSFNSRFADGGGTNPEELIAAAQAGCYAMALAADLSAAGFTAKDVRVKAALNLDMTGGKPTITEIALTVGAEVPGIDAAAFQKIAENTRKTCPVARALLGTVKLTLDATLKG